MTRNFELSLDQARAFTTLRTFALVKHKRTAPRISLGGYAGTGKTTVSSELANELVHEYGKRIAFLAPTGKAASVLRRKLARLAFPPDYYIGTIHGFLYRPVLDEQERLRGWVKRHFRPDGEGFVSENARDEIARLDLVMVDEASMLNEALEKDVAHLGVPIIAVGDHGQLPPVQGRNTWMQRPEALLETIHRQAEDNPILALAEIVRETGKLPPRENLHAVGIETFSSLKDFAPALQRSYAEVGLGETAMITWTNRLRTELNESVQKHLFGELRPVPGSQLICLKNDYPVVNGMRGFVEEVNAWDKAHQYHLRIAFPDEPSSTDPTQALMFHGPVFRPQFGLQRPVDGTQAASELAQHPISTMEECGALYDWGYALTCHKAQGSEFRHVYIVLEPGSEPNDFARWLYTAITRASEKVSFVWTKW